MDQTSTLSSDFTELTDKDADKHAAFPDFKKQMEGRAYGHEALNDAWGWFKRGWEDGCNAGRAQKLGSLRGMRE